MGNNLCANTYCCQANRVESFEEVQVPEVDRKSKGISSNRLMIYEQNKAKYAGSNPIFKRDENIRRAKNNKSQEYKPIAKRHTLENTIETPRDPELPPEILSSNDQIDAIPPQVVQPLN